MTKRDEEEEMGCRGWMQVNGCNAKEGRKEKKENQPFAQKRNSEMCSRFNAAQPREDSADRKARHAVALWQALSYGGCPRKRKKKKKRKWKQGCTFGYFTKEKE